MDAAPAIPVGVSIVLSTDRLTASLVIETGIEQSLLTADAIDAAAAAQGVVHTPELAANIRAALDTYPHHTGDSAFRASVATGRPPEHGRDGGILFEPGLDPAEEPAAHTPAGTDHGGAVDFYSQSAFTSVHANQVIGRITEPTPGVDGYDVTGKIIAAKPGRACEPTIDNTVTVDDQGRLVACRGGIIEHEGGRLRIISELQINENVDFSTGNVIFPGDVVVNKDVKDCFNLRIGGSLIVHELVEAATLICAVDCTLHRGMAARSKGSVTTGRDLTARYLYQAAATVGRDLLVQREIGACIVNVSRHVVSPQAALVGGRLTVGSRCHLARIGSESGTPTLLVLGALGELDALQAKLADQLPAWEARASRAKYRAASPEAAKDGPEAAASRIRTAIEQLNRVQRANTLTQVRIEKILHAGVTLHMGEYAVRTMKDLKGPVCLSLGADGVPRIEEPKGAPPLETVATIEPIAAREGDTNDPSAQAA